MGSPRDSDLPTMDRSGGGSIIVEAHTKLTKLRSRLEHQEGEIQQKLQNFYDIK